LSSKLYIESLSSPSFNALELANLCGAFHHNIHILESFFKVNIKPTDDAIQVKGLYSNKVKAAKLFIKQLHPHAMHPITEQTILSLLKQTKEHITMSKSIQLNRKSIAPRNAKQIQYLDGIDEFDLSFAVGPAGTGKTYLAVAKAIEHLEKGEVQRLVFVRPAVEAGEKLGFLPGDLVEKVLPYLRPIYDALYEMVGFKEAQKLIHSDIIEVLPLAFMRGRTLNEAFVILDEAQNSTIPQMKMFLTRIGFGSKAVVTGDITQIDLPKGTDSGLSHAVHLLKKTEGIKTFTFSSKEVVRHPLVSKIIDCYESELKGQKK
jgi:phosphate starvation-inducible protein PhoH and related proteins